MNAIRLEKAAVADLSVDPSNVRRHPDRNVDAIKASLRRFGQQHPIVVDSKNVVRVGNGRLEAMRQLGWAECWVARTDLSDADLVAYAIADNRTSELAAWDLDGLDVTLKGLADGGLSLDEIGFNEGDIANLLGPSEWKKKEEKENEGEEKQYAEKIAVVVHDMTYRAKITAAIKELIEKEGWTEIAHVH